MNTVRHCSCCCARTFEATAVAGCTKEYCKILRMSVETLCIRRVLVSVPHVNGRLFNTCAVSVLQLYATPGIKRLVSLAGKSFKCKYGDGIDPAFETLQFHVLGVSRARK